MGLSDDELAAIEKRCAGATPEPWVASVEGRDHKSGDTFIQRGPEDARQPDLYLSTDPGESLPSQDIDFIAQARQDVPRLLAEVRRLRGE